MNVWVQKGNFKYHKIFRCGTVKNPHFAMAISAEYYIGQNMNE